jgi:uncharacterized protein (DUF488 family)
VVADVRRFPGSRRWPQYGRDRLAAALAARGIDYRHLPGLGGRRRDRLESSPNTAWQVEAFNAYADHMQSAEFQSALAALEELASAERTALMCAEALPWQCHRRLIADALVARGWQVENVLSAGHTRPHVMTEFARVSEGRVTYPAASLF